MRKRISIIVSVIVLLFALSGSALAAQGPAYVGACNMLVALNVGANGGLLGALGVPR